MSRPHRCFPCLPRSERNWFKLNKMRPYNADRDILVNTDDQKNGFLLRRDLHADFDDRKFVVVPKCGKWVVHVIKMTFELGKLYHNVPLYDIEAVAPEFLLTRFAWAIFPGVCGFLETMSKRELILCQVADGKANWVTRSTPPDELDTYVESRGQSRNPSPKKRQRDEPIDGSGNAEVDESDTDALNTEPEFPDSEAEYEDDVATLRQTLPMLLDQDEVPYSSDRW
ncbi:MAG: hypothetical protein M1839_008330 [Geoglossum umbratile]|nr:MAG: hypothetical protein M1839_008330 [Geoglossum umbratile]